MQYIFFTDTVNLQPPQNNYYLSDDDNDNDDTCLKAIFKNPR